MGETITNIVGGILFALVFIGGVTMAVSGVSSDSYLGLLFLAGGGMLFWMAFKYRKTSTDQNDVGEDQTVGPGTIIFVIAIGVALVAAGLFTLLHGFQ